tara:strand:- start:2218 stop:2412 length:195 start_codon:yes stop_codon:yes gene_type:complete
MKPTKRSLSSIMSESYSIYFEFFGIIVAWIVFGYIISKKISFIAIIGGVIHGSIKAYKDVIKNN